VRLGKVSAEEAQSRDMLLYLIRQLGVQTNQEIGEHFGLIHSAVSRRLSLFKDALKKDAAPTGTAEQRRHSGLRLSFSSAGEG
jgi:hypothetical protein